MITSATGGEGKTTLSAHLAARCANAGTSTLLIDADMRRASLGRLLDVPVGPGLGDVLAGEVDLDAALITVQAGGFHFLSAGTPGRDPSRVLKSTRLAELIGRLRQTYDLVIIDTPPVLPVADALIMGRWADGAVMAARYDASRLPLVERANRQLALGRHPGPRRRRQRRPGPGYVVWRLCLQLQLPQRPESPPRPDRLNPGAGATPVLSGEGASLGSPLHARSREEPGCPIWRRHPRGRSPRGPVTRPRLTYRLIEPASRT